MDREDMILTPEEEARNRSDMLLLLNAVRPLSRDSKLYLAGMASGLLQSGVLAPDTAMCQTT